MQPILKLNNISYSYHSIHGEIPALDNISFDVLPGEFISLIGPSGCGKSTLLSIIARLETPEGGTISFYHPMVPSIIHVLDICYSGIICLNGEVFTKMYY